MNSGRESRVDCLSDREVEVLRLISEGLSLEEVARRLHRSVDTVKSHRRRIGRKLGVRNRVELIKIAIESGLVSVNVESGAGDRAGLLTALEHAGVAACIVEDGVVTAANRDFEGLSPEGPATLDRVFADAGARWLAEVTASVQESGAGYAAVRLAGRDEVVGVRACRAPGGIALVLELPRRPEPQRPPPRDEDAARHALAARLVTDSTLYAPEGGVYAVLLWRLTKLLEASHAVLLELDDGDFRAVTVWSRQRGLESSPPRFQIPADLLAGGQPVHIPDSLPEIYPDAAKGLPDPARAMGAVPVQGAASALLGAVVLFSDRPWPDAQEALAALRPVAARLGCELARARAERRLAELERRLLRLCDVVPAGVFRADPSGEILWCSPATAGVLGIAPEQCLGRGWLRAVELDDRAELERLAARAETTRVEEARVRLAGASGRAVVRLTSDFGPRGERSGLIGTLAREAPDQPPQPPGLGPASPEPFRSLIVDGIGRADPHTDPDTILGNLVAPEEAEFTRRLLAQALAGRSVAGAVVRLREAPAGPLWARIAMAPHARDASGAVASVLVHLWDETHAWLAQAVAALARLGWAHAAAEHQRGQLPAFALVESARVGALCTDDHGVFLAANAAARRWLGLTADRLGSASVCDIRTAPGFRSGSELFAEHAAMRGGSGIIHILDDGEVRRLAFRGHPTPCGLHVATLEPS